MPVNTSVYQQSQRVVHTENATYENILFNDNVADFAGTFTCEVGNARGAATETVELNGELPIIIILFQSTVYLWPNVCLYPGVSISRCAFSVGMLAAARCTSDTLAISMEWLVNGTVVESAVSTQILDLIIPLVNDSIHGDVFVCRVTRDYGMMATQNLAVNVDGRRTTMQNEDVASTSLNCSPIRFTHRQYQ